MNAASRNKLTRLVIAIVVAASLCLLGHAVVSRVLSEQDAARWQTYHAWLSTKVPCLDAAINIPSASTDAQFVASGGPNGPTAPEVTYLVPDERDGYLLVAHFRLRIGANNEPIDIETSDYRCLNLRTTSLVTQQGKSQRRYQGVFLDAPSFAAAVAGLQKNAIPDDILRRMESSNEDMAFRIPEYDRYVKYLPTEPSH